jgi:O-acetylhomoserine (thiol)-lyase
MIDMQNFKPDTLCIHAGYKPGNGEPRVVPIVQSTTYTYNSSQEMGALFDLQEDGFFYTRIGNPTNDAVEKKIAALEGGVGALLTSSGQAASLMAVLNICTAGDHVVSSSAIYGGTFNLFYKTMKEMGIETTFVSPNSTKEELLAAMRPNTKCVFAETLSNPSLVVTDLEMFATAAHEHGVPLIVDNTFPTPINCRPFQFGADIVVHSTTKYMDGHAVQVGGVIVDSGNFNWDNGKYPALTQPDESYHGVIYTKQFGKAAYIAKARVHLMRDLGAQSSPMNAFLLNLGLETLALRVQRHCENAMAVAETLEKDPRIAWVNYPNLPSNPSYKLAQKYLPNGSCGVVSFGIKGGREAATKFMDSLQMASVVTHVADLRTCVLHPASTTHRQMTDKQLEEAGVPADLIRLSVGIENIQDILNDINQALEKTEQ